MRIEKLQNAAVGEEYWAVIPCGDYEYCVDHIVVHNQEEVSKSQRCENDLVYSISEAKVASLRARDFDTLWMFTEQEEAIRYLREVYGNAVVYETPSGDGVGIYKGGLTHLTQIPNDAFDWVEDEEYNGMTNHHLTLNNIYEQAVAKGLIGENDLMTVVYERALDGAIYECGNYRHGRWMLNGTTRGYA